MEASINTKEAHNKVSASTFEVYEDRQYGFAWVHGPRGFSAVLSNGKWHEGTPSADDLNEFYSFASDPKRARALVLDAHLQLGKSPPVKVEIDWPLHLAHLENAAPIQPGMSDKLREGFRGLRWLSIPKVLGFEDGIAFEIAELTEATVSALGPGEGIQNEADPLVLLYLSCRKRRDQWRPLECGGHLLKAAGRLGTAIAVLWRHDFDTVFVAVLHWHGGLDESRIADIVSLPTSEVWCILKDLRVELNLMDDQISATMAKMAA